jgi:hypothetical protein
MGYEQSRDGESSHSGKQPASSFFSSDAPVFQKNQQDDELKSTK